MRKILYWQINSFWLKFVYLLFLIILLIPFYRISEPPTAGIDNSWRIALEMAYEKGLVFGRDIIYTYGPLGRLTQRIGIATSNFQLFVFDIFCFLNVGFLLYQFLPKPLHLYQFTIHFVIFIITSSIYGEWMSFLLFFVSIYSGLLFLKRQNHWFLVHAIAMGVINFYIKANYGVIALGFVFVLLFYAFFTQRLSFRNLLYYLSGAILLLILLAIILKADLWAYFYSSIQIIKGYNESQSFFPENRLRAVVSSYLVFGAFLVSFLVFVFAKIKKKDFSQSSLDSFFVLGCVAVCAFVLLKYAFVRADDAHLMSFVRSISLPFLMLAFFIHENWLKRTAWVLIVLNIVSYVLFYQPIYGKLNFSITDNLKTKSYILPQYFKDISKTNSPSYQLSYPKDVLDLIGNKTVDLVPTEVSEIYLNKLNYNPRPIVQSYQAYNEYLDKKNQEKYLSNTAPDFVVYGTENLDGKYGIGDETATLLALLEKYEPVRVWKNHLLLKKASNPKRLELIKQTTKHWKLGEKYELGHIDTTKKQFVVIKLQTSYNWFGKVLNLFFQPPHLNMKLIQKNGKTEHYRTVPILLNKGIILSSKIDDVKDAEQFFQEAFVKNKTIVSLEFDEIIRKRNGFNKNIEIIEELYELR